jgi:drug/metabolite transporter (DMT)-like permease
LKELLGALIAAVAALLYDAGYVLEKQALTGMPPLRISPAGMWRAAASSPRWLIGFTAMLGGLVLQVGALTLAPVSVVQPILAGGLIALAAVGSNLLGERLTRRHVAALVLVLFAVVAVALSARGGDALARGVPAGRFFALAVVVAAAGGLAARAGKSSPTRMRPGRINLSGLAGMALGAGLLYGLGAVAEKAVATRLVSRGVLEGAWSSLGTPYPWVFLIATLAGMLVFQVGLQANPASLMASLTNTTSTVCALVGASLVFDESVLPPGWWSLLRLIGFASVLGAVMLVAADGETETASLGARLPRPGHAAAP